ncbi:transcriptional antiterminator [Staphylococcus gallinarum]|nr:transcriptional antiterminator [Staphylococcus gallinarum]
MFLPADDTVLSEIISDLSSKLVEHLDSLDEFMQEPEQITEIIKQSYLSKIKNLLN